MVAGLLVCSLAGYEVYMGLEFLIIPLGDLSLDFCIFFFFLSFIGYGTG